MIARRRQVGLVVTALLAAAAACQNHHREQQHAPPGRPAPSASRAAAEPGPAAPGAFTLVASGGILPDSSVVDRAGFDGGGVGYNFRPVFEGVRSAVSRADLALCHLDAVFGANAPYAGAPPHTFVSELAQALAATGYDSCSTASEHTLDAGADGVWRTLDALDRAGVRHAGSARSEAEARGTLLRAGGAMVAHLAYTAGSNGPFPPGQPWAVRLIDGDRIAADARAARAAGADIVVVSLHWGPAWQEAPDEQQLALARRLTASQTGGRPDIDLILGTHAHVPQPYEKVNGTWVVYGLGDQVAGQPADQRGPRDPRAHQSTLARFTFAPPARSGGRWEVARAEFVPGVFDPDAGRVVNVGEAVARGADLQGVLDRIQTVVFGRGAAKDGLMMGR
ncbi:CapA family protein [Streptomyces kebangsaanensis]|uniref:CapA family protein n=1 Tax=Streptomyces kebangsaanensis TaxID=864058 RepID=UPI00093BB1D4|nr:CapA family protein [Streptomyces kebangsaanensis]